MSSYEIRIVRPGVSLFLEIGPSSLHGQRLNLIIQVEVSERVTFAGVFAHVEFLATEFRRNVGIFYSVCSIPVRWAKLYSDPHNFGQTCVRPACLL